MIFKCNRCKTLEDSVAAYRLEIDRLFEIIDRLLVAAKVPKVGGHEEPQAARRSAPDVPTREVYGIDIDDEVQHGG